MSLIRFLFYRKKEKSPLASRKYGEKIVDPKKLDKSMLTHKLIKSNQRIKEKEMNND